MEASFEKSTVEKLELLADAIKKSHDVVVLSGAGISVPSGIPDFRSAQGLYNTSVGKYPAETIISHDFFYEHTDEFYDFYKHKMIWQNARPNAMHLLLALLEQEGKLRAIVTQNIDCLHTLAGNKKVFELHGAIDRNYCERCGNFFGLEKIVSSDGVPRCDQCGGVIKPDVVLYGESLDSDVLQGAVREISNADMLIVIGTSLVVYPAAGFVGYFRGNTTCVINKSATYFDSDADLLIGEDCEKVAIWLCEKLGYNIAR